MRFITAIILLTNGLFCLGQTDTTAVPFVSYWANGDAYDFKVTKLKQELREGRMTKNDSSSYVVNFKVIDSTATSYKINWSFKTNFQEFNIPVELSDKFSKYERTNVIYTTNEVGEFTGIENWEELSVIMKEMFVDLIDVLSKENGQGKDELKKSMQPFMSIYESKEGLEQLVFKELYFFHFPFGVEFPVKESIEYEELLPNVFGGDPIRGDAKLQVEEVDFESFYCKLVQEMKINPEDTKSIILTLFKRMGLKDREMKKAMKTAVFDVADRNTYEYYFYPGIPIRIETNRRSLIDIDQEKGERIEKTIIELIE